MSGWQPWVADALAAIGVVAATLGVLGLWRLPDIYTKLHAAAKVASLGVAAFAGAAAFSGDAETAARAALAALFVLVTAAMTSHAISRAAADMGDPLRGGRVRDESPMELDRDGR